MKNRTNVRWLTQLALLAAILLVMNYTPLGYLQLVPLSASLLTVPVAIGAMTMGPLAGAILGGIFGATSFIQMVEGKSAMGAALFSVNPFGAFVVSFVARVLEGLCAALIFNALRTMSPASTTAPQPFPSSWARLAMPGFPVPRAAALLLVRARATNSAVRKQPQR